MKTIQYLTTFLVSCLALPLSPCTAQFAFLFDWNNPSGGAYSNQFNWSSISGGIPDNTSEIARFQINATYSVQVSADYTVGGLAARQQGNVTMLFDPPGNFTPRKIYNTGSLNVDPTGGGTVQLALTNGDVRVSGTTTVGGEFSDGTARLVLTNAVLNTQAAQVGAGNATTSEVTVGPNSQWTGSGPLDLGVSGDTFFTIQASFGTSCFIFCVTAPRQGLANHAGVVMAENSQANASADVFGNWITGDLIVGDQGSAEVNVLGTQLIAPNGTNVSSVGSLTSASANLGAQPGSSGEVNVAGFAVIGLTPTGSTWNVSAGLALGGDQSMAGGTGRLAIGPFNSVTVGTDLKMWPGGTLELEKNGQFSITGTARLGGKLEFTISDMSQPQLNDMFQILTAGSVMGNFNSAILPPLPQGQRWDIIYNPTNVMLKVVAGIAGDFDFDGDVDGRDFLIWQRGGSSTPLSSTDLAAWQANYGLPLAATATTVPEPRAILLMPSIMALLSGRYPAKKRPLTVGQRDVS